MSTHISRLTPASADDSDLVADIAGLVNDVYRVAEHGLWRSEATRTTIDEIAGNVRADELVIARRGDRLVGVVRVCRIGPDTGEFGMLAADPEVRGQGVGRDLAAHAEEVARSQGCTRMQLELLVPRDWVLDSKEFLAAWYTRRGYQLQRIGRIEESYPHLAPMLGTAADFRIYHRAL